MLALALLAQLAVAQAPVLPVLSFPDPALDDTSAYRGYQTRLFRDAARNTLQLYIDQRSARVVHLLADADNASIGYTVRAPDGTVPAITWAAAPSRAGRSGRTRHFTHTLTAAGSTVSIGWFLLGSMRVERDFQYDQRARTAFAAAPYRLPDLDRLFAALERLPAGVRTQHLARLNARSVAQLRARLHPHPTLTTTPTTWRARVVQATLDGRDTLTVELTGRTADVLPALGGDSVTLQARRGDAVTFTSRITTTARTLTPLSREQIFTPDFLAFLAETAARGARVPATDSAAIRARRMERQVRGVELLVSREKLMAGLPTYATYFGRDMLMTALMMRPIWRHETLEAVISTALGKLGPGGEVSHEEALGDQAVRESAGAYATLVEAALGGGNAAGAEPPAVLLARADSVLRALRTTRENYHMIDDEYQLPIVVARWITDPAVPASAKRAFLNTRGAGGATHAQQLVRELDLVTRLTAAYAEDPVTANLIAFAPRAPAGWETASWRDSGAGYAGGRYAMDINAIWVPHALESVGRILDAMRDLGIATGAATAGDTPLARYAREPARLQQAIATWKGASRHFLVRRDAAQAQAAVTARLAAMPAEERGWWQAQAGALPTDGLEFLAVALDATGAPIPVMNTDAATRIFLGDGDGRTTPPSEAELAQLDRDARLFALPYPTGLFVARIGPVVANDAYAPPAVWSAFVKDPYHGPRVVWGREVNLFLLGVAQHLALRTPDGARDAARRSALGAMLEQVRLAVEQSGFHAELWSYGVERGRLGAQRYGSGGDIQLWSTTDLAVQYVLARHAIAR
ncbi:MAG: hypothetical protein IT355_02775 [Gemmatimonadaceae bacterium]|nr:hypothetical protein [Gemmatimonadaceae bacterium]